MYAYITLNDWMIWVKTRNNEFASFLREIGTPCILSSKAPPLDDTPGFFIPILPGWCVRYNRGLLLQEPTELIELRICEIEHTV